MPVDGPQYPVNLLLAGVPVLVVGGGPVATQKVRGLLDGGADTLTVVAPSVTPELADLGVRVEQRPYRSPEAADYRLVVTATDDRDVNAQVSADAQQAGVWVNSADDPVNCTFTLPARVRRGRLLLTASTGGHSPAVSSYVRSQLEALYGPEWDLLIQILADARERIIAEGGSTEQLDWRSALDSGLLEMVQRDPKAAREHLEQCLSSSSE